MRSSLAVFVLVLLVSARSLLADEIYIVSQVVDGNTLELSSGERVRLIGVHSPALYDEKGNRNAAISLDVDPGQYSSYAQPAGQFLHDFIFKHGGQLVLRYDSGNADREHRDQYRQLLAYAYLPLGPDGATPLLKMAGNFMVDKEAGVLVNGSIIRSGLAAVDLDADYHYKKMFTEMEQEARKNKRGIWSSATLAEA
jgi:micrococcal nuclease